MKLTEEDVCAIGHAYAAGETQAQIGRRFGVRQTTIGMILRGETWPDVARRTFETGRGNYHSNGHHQTTHGHAAPLSGEYRSWRSMKARCLNPRCDSYASYGGRGITVCERWRDSFENFLADMGPRPSLRHNIDRINNDGNYEPSNCRWATAEQQANNTRANRRIAIGDTSLTVAEWARARGVRKCVIINRLRRGWSEESAVMTPRRFRRIA